MKRTMIALALTLTSVVGSMKEQPVAPATPMPTPTPEVVGTGWVAAMACAGCVSVAGLTVASGGWIALAAAAITNPKGLAVTAGCIGACVRAFD